MFDRRSALTILAMLPFLGSAFTAGRDYRGISIGFRVVMDAPADQEQ